MTRPPVPAASALDPLIDIISAGTLLARVYDRRYGPLGFNSTNSSARFRPVRDRGRVTVPTAYLGDSPEVVLAEGLLRAVSALAQGASHRIYRRQVDPLDLSVLRLERPVRVVRLHGPGLTRLRLLRRHIIDCDEADYPYTAQWAQALWGCRARPHGLVWTSRQDDGGRAYMLWQDRLPRGALSLAGPVLRLDRDPGLDLVRVLCAESNVDFDG